MSVFISDKEMDKLYIQSFRPEWADLYQRFWSHSQNSQLRIIRCKNSWFRLEFLNLNDNTLRLVF